MTDLRAIYGTDEPPPARQLLVAGPLTTILEAGQLRDIRWHGSLVLRGIAYLLRDANWGTLAVDVDAMSITQAEHRFAVTYQANTPELRYSARIEGRADGHLSFEVKALADTDFVTNRTGFVVLHPDTAAGGKLGVTHTDGRIEEMVFPARISPDQPAVDIAALTHHPASGLTALTNFDGGVFEMEDQRNWADASFKTYVRPVAWPRPYVIAAGTEETQAVRLTLRGAPAAAALAETETFVTGTVPPLWLRLDPDQPVPVRVCLPQLARGLILRGGAVPDHDRLAAAAALAARERMDLAVEVVLPARDAVDEAVVLARALARHPPALLFVALERDRRTRTSDSLPEGEVPFQRIAQALRGSLPGQALAFGTPAFFTEFNRNPPPTVDAAFFSIAATVHAADDASVIETLGVLREIAQSATALCPGAGLVPGPLTIAPTISPYAPRLALTDGTTRTCMAPQDPRHAGLFGAAHLVGSIAALAPVSLALAPAFATGPYGLAAPDGTALPLAHVHAEFAAAVGRALHTSRITESFATISWEGGGLAANLTPDVIAVPDLPRPLDVLSSSGWQPLVDRSWLHGYATIRWQGGE